jgi:large subunit ribosomal protein L11
MYWEAGSVVCRVRILEKAQEAAPRDWMKALSQKVDSKKIPELCRVFNEKSAHIAKGTIVRCIIRSFDNGEVDVSVKLPPISDLIKKATAIEKGSSLAGKTNPVAVLSAEKCKEIATSKMSDLNAKTLEDAIATVRGSARSMGVKVE